MFKSLGSLLQSALNRKPIREGVRGAVILEAAREAVLEVFLKRVAAFIVPTAYRSGIITLTVTNAAVAQEVRMNAPKFLRYLNEQVGSGTVKQIRVRLARRDENDVLS